MIDLTKLIELYISRKDKFAKSADRAKRRFEYFSEVSEIDTNTDMSSEEKRARKNSAAQKLTGNGLASYELVDYYYRHPDFINFEVIAPIVGFWDQVLIKTTDENGRITKLDLDLKIYSKEIAMAIFSLIFFVMIFIVFLSLGNRFINYMVMNFYISKSVMGIAYLILISPVFFMFLFLFYWFLNLTDLKRLVK